MVSAQGHTHTQIILNTIAHRRFYGWRFTIFFCYRTVLSKTSNGKIIFHLSFLCMCRTCIYLDQCICFTSRRILCAWMYKTHMHILFFSTFSSLSPLSLFSFYSINLTTNEKHENCYKMPQSNKRESNNSVMGGKFVFKNS